MFLLARLSTDVYASFMIRNTALGLALVALAWTTTACTEDNGSSSGGDGGSGGSGTGMATGGAGGGTGGSDPGPCGPDLVNPNESFGAGSDPAGGVFTMEDALVDLPEGDGPLRAIITTELGAITCTLEPEEAPLAVANFVGLARGVRPWLNPASNEWVGRKFYDGLTFHRIIDDFMAQGGDPLGTGTGGPGYQFDDEFGSLMHKPGTLSMANAGPNTNGSQFFITEVTTDWLDGMHTIMGYCEPMAVIETLTATPTNANDQPLTAVHTQSIEITRCPVE